MGYRTMNVPDSLKLLYKKLGALIKEVRTNREDDRAELKIDSFEIRARRIVANCKEKIVLERKQSWESYWWETRVDREAERLYTYSYVREQLERELKEGAVI